MSKVAILTGSFRRPNLSDKLPETSEPTSQTTIVTIDMTEIVAAAAVSL